MEHHPDRAMPKLLSLRSGTWNMTLEELIPVADSIFRPIEYVVRGAQAILSTIDSTPADGALARQTRELLEEYPEPSETVAEFYMHNNSWVPVPGMFKAGESSQQDPQSQPPDPQSEKRVRALEKAVKRMGDLMKVIDGRLKNLESSKA